MNRYIGLIIGIVLTHRAFAADPVGTVTPVGAQSEVYVKMARIEGVTPVARQEIIRLGDHSVAELDIYNGDHILLSSHTIITVEDYLTKDSEYLPMIYRLLKGKLKALIERKDKERFMIRTDNAVISVKGTDFVVESSSSHITQLTTLSGVVGFKTLGDAGEITLSPGMRSMIVRSSDPVTPYPISEGDFHEIQGLFGLERSRLRIPEKKDAIESEDRALQEILERVIQPAIRQQGLLTVEISF